MFKLVRMENTEPTQPAFYDPSGAANEPLLRFFTDDMLEFASELCCALPPSAERTIMLRKLLEAQDALPRASQVFSSMWGVSEESLREFLRFFDPLRRPEETRKIATRFFKFADFFVEHGSVYKNAAGYAPGVVVCLEKMLQAQDTAVRAALVPPPSKAQQQRAEDEAFMRNRKQWIAERLQAARLMQADAEMKEAPLTQEEYVPALNTMIQAEAAARGEASGQWQNPREWMESEIERLREIVADRDETLATFRESTKKIQSELERLAKEKADAEKREAAARAEKQAILTGLGADGADDETAAEIHRLRKLAAEQGSNIATLNRVVAELRMALDVALEQRDKARAESAEGDETAQVRRLREGIAERDRKIEELTASVSGLNRLVNEYRPRRWREDEGTDEGDAVDDDGDSPSDTGWSEEEDDDDDDDDGDAEAAAQEAYDAEHAEKYERMLYALRKIELALGLTEDSNTPEDIARLVAVTISELAQLKRSGREILSDRVVEEILSVDAPVSKFVVDAFFESLEEQLKLRPSLMDYVTNEKGEGELRWLVLERDFMLQWVNRIRAGRNRPPVTLEDIRRVEKLAVDQSYVDRKGLRYERGHEYMRKVAHYCAELVLIDTSSPPFATAERTRLSVDVDTAFKKYSEDKTPENAKVLWAAVARLKDFEG